MRSAEHSTPIAAEPQPEHQDAGARPQDANTVHDPENPSGPDPIAQQRRLTVVTRFRGHAYVPEIRMGGHWLPRAGFPAGAKLAVLVTPGQLVVKVVAPPGPPPARFVHEASSPYCLCEVSTRRPRRMPRAKRR